MFKFLKNWLIQSLITSLALGGIMTSGLTAFATETVIYESVDITSISVTPDPYDVNSTTSLSVNYCVDAPAKVTVGIYQADGSNSKIVNVLTNTELTKSGCYSVTWNGTYGTSAQVGTTGQKVTAGTYFYGVYAENLVPSSDYMAKWITVTNSGTGNGNGSGNGSGNGGSETCTDRIEILDLELVNATFSPTDGEEVEFIFEINCAAKISLDILDEDGEVLREIADRDQMSKGEHRLYFDGKDDFDDLLDEDEYTYKLTAELDDDKDKKTGQIRIRKDFGSSVDTEDPRLYNFYVTKDSFDPGRREIPYFIFNLTARADVVAYLYDTNGSIIETIYDEENLESGVYKVALDSDKLTNREGSFTYKFYAENNVGDDTVTGTIEVAEDFKDDENKPNAYRDSVDIEAIPYNGSGSLAFEFRLDTDAEVTFEIRDARTVIADVVEDADAVAGLNTIYWDGKDNYGELLADGIYEYKLIAENSRGKDVEWGKFSISETTFQRNPERSCAGFPDVAEDSKYCEAITWAKGQGIFDGNDDGTFRPNDPINRVEALKVVLNTLDIRIPESFGDTGFSDLKNNSAWYIPVIKVALSLGVVEGYPDGTFKPGKTVIRSEALVMLLKAARAKTNLVIPTAPSDAQPYFDVLNKPSTWYLNYAWVAKENNLSENDFYFYPSEAMSRAQMADLVYRFHQAGLDN